MELPGDFQRKTHVHDMSHDVTLDVTANTDGIPTADKRH